MAQNLSSQPTQYQRPRQTRSRPEALNPVTASAAKTKAAAPDTAVQGKGTGTANLDDPVRYLKGVGPWRAELLAGLGIESVRDLIEYIPTRHEEYRPAVSIDQIQEGQVDSIVAQVLRSRQIGFGQTARVTASVTDGTGQLNCIWFSAPWMLEHLRPGSWVRLRGKVRLYSSAPQLVNPQTKVLDDEPTTDRIDNEKPFVPVYRACEGLSSKQIGRLVLTAWQQASDQITEWYDPQWRRQRRLLDRNKALQWIHWPDERQHLQDARKRLAYDELLLMQLTVAIRRWHVRDSREGRPMQLTEQIDRRIRQRFAFQFTAAQNRAVREIADDMAEPVPMNRLLQGDVGSGKTAVGLYAALVAIANHWQTVILAPTEILAEQHHQRISKYLTNSKVRYGLLTGSTGRSMRTELLNAATAGELDLLVGTHALLEEDVEFDRLGFVIVDEQHRFGVRQRAILRGKGYAPHYLVMTATPIPRTLAMTIFGDLDVSVIDELPPGRLPIRTRLLPSKQEADAFEFVRSRVKADEQAFIVYPLVSESEALPLKAATDQVERLRRQYFPERSVGLIHGKMPPAQKQQVMADFAAGRLHILVATTVIEVGIDVPQATVMVVQHAERYGLAQLHQLRGRVGRSNRPGHCLLIADTDNEQALERLQVLCDTCDGFAIAESDLRLRGPGELIGLRQHGLPELRVADLLADGDLLRMARQDASALIQRSPRLQGSEYAALRAELARRAGQVLPLIDMA